MSKKQEVGGSLTTRYLFLLDREKRHVRQRVILCRRPTIVPVQSGWCLPSAIDQVAKRAEVETQSASCIGHYITVYLHGYTNDFLQYDSSLLEKVPPGRNRGS